MCDKCQQLETDIQHYRRRLQQGLDPLTVEVQRTRKLLAIGLDPRTIERVADVIQELVQHKPAYALPANRLGTNTGYCLEGLWHPARVTH